MVLDNKDFYQAVQKYGEAAKTSSNGQVSTYLTNNPTLPEAVALSAKINATNTALNLTCNGMNNLGGSGATCNIGYIYDTTKANTLVNNNYSGNCCKTVINPDGTTNTSTTSAVPSMTSNTAPSGLAFTNNKYNATYDAWKAFDGANPPVVNIDTYLTGVNAVNPYIGYKFTTQKIINKIIWKSSPSITYNPVSIKIQASNDTTTGLDGTWNDLSTFSNLNLTAAETRNLPFYNSTSYYAYRVYVLTVGSSTYVENYGIKFIEAQ